MKERVNPAWIAEIQEKVADAVSRREDVKIDRTTFFNPAAQWLITFLSNRDIPFKVVNLGAGVKRITTETDTCPFCKKKL